LDNLRDEPPYHHQDIFDYLQYMRDYEGLEDSEVIDNEFPEPPDPSYLGLIDDLEDFYT